MNIYKRTQTLLRNTKQSPETIAAATGLKQRWIYLFKKGNQNDYGVFKVQKLYRHLSK